MFAQTVRLAGGSGAPAHGSLPKAAAPPRSPVNASVKRASQAPCIAAAPARSAFLPCAAVRGNGTSRSRSPNFHGSAPENVFSFLEANKEGMSHALLRIDNTAWESGDKNIPPVLMGCFFDINTSTVEGILVKHGPLMCMDSETTMRIPVIAHIECRGSRQLVKGVKISGWLRKDGYMEFRARDLEKGLKKVGAQPGDWVLVSMKRQGDQLLVELKVMQQEAVTEEVRAAMKPFLVTRKPRGQKAKQVAVTAAGPKPAAAAEAACDQQEEEEKATEATGKQQQEKAKQGVKPTAAPAPSAPEATAYPPAPIASTVNNFYGPVYNDGCVYNDRSNFSKE